MASMLSTFQGLVRLATPDGIDRLAIIALAGGLQTDEFNYQRPKAREFPGDVLDSWRHNFAQCLRSAHDIIIVAEEPADLVENKVTSDIASHLNLSSNNGKHIVGFAQVKLRPKYPNNRGFKRCHVQLSTSGGMKRDLDSENYLEYGIRLALERSKLEGTKISLDVLIVDPAHQRKGHGKKLVNWILDLARQDKVVVGVAATRMGIPLYQSLDFERVHAFEVATGVSVVLMRCDPNSEDPKANNNDNSHTMSQVTAEIDKKMSEICDNLILMSL